MRAILTTVVVAVLAVPLLADDKPGDLTPERRRELEKKAADLRQRGLALSRQGKQREALEAFSEHLDVCRQLYPASAYPNGHPELTASLQRLAAVFANVGRYDRAEALLREAVAVLRKLYPDEKDREGQRRLAQGQEALGELLIRASDYRGARKACDECLALTRKLYPGDSYPDGHEDLARSIDLLAVVHLYLGEYARAEPLLHESLALRRKLYPAAKYPDGDPRIALSLGNLAGLYQQRGEYSRAEGYYREVLAIFEKVPLEQFFGPSGQAYRAHAHDNLGMVLRDQGEYAQAEPYLRKSLELRRQIFGGPNEEAPHPEVMKALLELAYLFLCQGEVSRAEAIYREAVAMGRKLYPRGTYPDGHPQLSSSLFDLGRVLREQGKPADAQALCREGYEMTKRWAARQKSSSARRHQAIEAVDLGMVLATTGNQEEGEALVSEGLKIFEELYPEAKYPAGDPDLAAALLNLAQLQAERGAHDDAGRSVRDGLAMVRKLYPPEAYPDGHPQLVLGLWTTSILALKRKKDDEARAPLGEALAMQTRLLRRYADVQSEAAARNYAATVPDVRDLLLFASRAEPSPAEVYDLIWDSRAALTRVEERRHRDLLSHRDPSTRELARELVQARQRVAAVLLRPLPDAAEQARELQARTEAKEDLERRIARQLKLAPGPAGRARLTPAGLRELLPGGAVFLDVARVWGAGPWPRARGRRPSAHYAAFVLRGDRPVARVDLGEAAAIDEACAAWRQALTAQRPDATIERRAAAALGKLVWAPLRDALPADLKTVYLAPEGLLARVPWGALPGTKPDTVLLDECAVCLVPHGPFLLDRLAEKGAAPAPGGMLLAVGDVDYDRAPDTAPALVGGKLPRGPLGNKHVAWRALPGTARERAQVAELTRTVARLTTVERSGRDAGTGQLLADLPAARYAHIATHGFFADPEFRSALRMDLRAFDTTGRDLRGGTRSPLVLSGLVLAGANREGKDAALDRGILTAEGVVGLPLEGLDLAVLSACETGLGEEGGGEGVYGLQRGFHVAGCRNVVASLWKVDDGATQALMALFYRNLWEKKLDPAEALRQAQLTLYRHPEAVPLAQKRGVDFSESDLPRVEEKPEEKPKRSPTASWAAFTFSGVRPAEQKPAPGR
jgi:CHAT domain-containing protein